MSRVTATLAAGALFATATTAGSGAAPAPAAATSNPPPIYWSPAPIASKPGEPPGYALFQRACAVCHGSGPARPGSRALAAKYKGSLPALLEERTDLKAPYIKQVVRQGLTVMPFFRKTELSDADLEAITTYLTRKRP